MVCWLDGALAKVALALVSGEIRFNAIKLVVLVAVKAWHEHLLGNAVRAASVVAVDRCMLAGVVLMVTVDWIGTESTPLPGFGIT